MQLKKQNQSTACAGSVAKTLALASCALLGVPALAADAPVDQWKVDGTVLLYSETDRVSAIEPVIKASRTFENESKLDLKLTVDSLTGNSHNGAAVLAAPQTFTSPSGKDVYQVNAGDVPLDDSFKDTRVAVSAQYSWLLNRNLRATSGLNFSNEYDFFSVGANAGLSLDLNQKNTTLSFLLGLESDTIEPVGGVPDPLTVQSDGLRVDSGESRTVTDALLGWTQVMNRRWVMQLNYNLSAASGYMTDPYKVVTLIDEVTGLPLEAEDLGGANIGPGDGQVYELRPDSRTKHALYWENRYARENDDVIAVGYRFMTDDWGISSHTLDLKYRWQLENGWFVQPHVRYYTQSEADFWYESLTEVDYNAIVASNDYASGDYRLGKLTDTTVGVKFGRELANGRRWDTRLEFMQQSGDTDAADVSAVIGQVGYRFYW
ncbi:MAG: DUF3570 domain-containing protein [Alcanivoracaceae bacterium]|nr:DUF3570 domain-containing protein [Alcanivoracaceae bacterium]